MRPIQTLDATPCRASSDGACVRRYARRSACCRIYYTAPHRLASALSAAWQAAGRLRDRRNCRNTSSCPCGELGCTTRLGTSPYGGYDYGLGPKGSKRTASLFPSLPLLLPLWRERHWGSAPCLAPQLTGCPRVDVSALQNKTPNGA